MMVYLQLIWVFFKIGALGFGGGYAMVSLIQTEVVNEHAWMTVTEYSDVLAISQMTPGPISINTATYVGYMVAGVPGAILSTISLCFPSILLMILVVKYLLRNKENKYVQYIMSGLRPVLGGLILAAALLLMNKENFCDFGMDGRNISVIIFVVSFVALHFFKVNPMWLIVVAGAIGGLVL